jgi:COP9 signalosome complex subunit 2
MRILIVRIELADIDHNEGLVFNHYDQAMKFRPVNLTPKQTAVLTHIEGIRALHRRDFNTARTKLYDAFKIFNEIGSARRVHSLPYRALAVMLLHETVNMFLAPEVMNFAQHPVLAPLAQLTDAYQALDIVLFNQRLESARMVFPADSEFYAGLLNEVRLFVLAGALKKLCKRYSRVEIQFAACELDSPQDEVRELVLKLIISGEFAGLIDYEADLIVMKRPKPPSPSLLHLDAILDGMEVVARAFDDKYKFK